MTELTDLLRQATDDLAPEDPDRLLASAVRRGAGLRRRRRATTTASLAGALAAVAVVVAVTLGGSGRPMTTEPLTDVTVTPTVTPGQTVSDGPGPRAVTVGRRAVGATFAQVLPGTVTREHDVPADAVHVKGGFESTFLWNGYRVSLMISPYAGGSRTTCHSFIDDRGNDQTCVRVRDGWAVHDPQMGDQSYNRWSNVLLDNGFQMWILIYNSGDEKGSSAGGPPPLDVSDLEKVATSDLWFS